MEESSCPNALNINIENLNVDYPDYIYIKSESSETTTTNEFQNNEANFIGGIQIVYFKLGEEEKPDIDPNDFTTVIYYNNKIHGRVAHSRALHMGYEYLLKQCGKFFSEWNCHASKCFAKMRIFKGDKELSLVNEHTCDKPEKTQILKYSSIEVKNYLKESLPRTPLKRKTFLRHFVPPDPNDSNTVIFYHDENGIKIAEYMGYKYLIDRKSTKWKCQKYSICSATIVIARDQTSALLGGKHTCDQIDESNSQLKKLSHYKVDGLDEILIETNTSNKNEIYSGANDIMNDLQTENEYYNESGIKIESFLKEEAGLDDKTMEEACDNTDDFSDYNNICDLKTENFSTAVTTPEISQSVEFNKNNENCELSSVPNKTHYIKSDKRRVKGLIPVKILDHLSDTEPKSKPVPLEDQRNYELLHSDQNLIFNGYNHIKSDYSITDDTFIYLCVNKRNKTCPGEVRLLPNKLIKSHTEHWCIRPKNSNENKALPHLDPSDSGTLLLYNNTLTFRAKALYRGFVYEKSLEKEYYSVWRCAKNRCNSNPQGRSCNCKALIKVFPMTSLLLEVGKHICFSNKAENLTVGNILKNALQGKNNVMSTPLNNNKEMLNKPMFPKFLDKKLIPVFHERDGHILIYNGFIYFQSDTMVNTNWFLCYNSKTKGCSGTLTVNAGNVESVSRHDCFRKMNESDEFLLLQGKRMVQYAMYKGYIYKKCSYFFSGQNVYRWNCHGGRVRCCDSILTTENENIISVSSHTCREEDDDGTEGKTQDRITCVNDEPITKRRRTDETLNETMNISNGTDLKNRGEVANTIVKTEVKTELESDDDIIILNSEEISQQSC